MNGFEVALIGFFGGIAGAAITNIAQLVIARQNRINHFRLAALEKRLSVHQEAYTLWTELFWKLHKKNELSDTILKCQEWWYKNCLYLDPNSRKAFKISLNLASTFNDIPIENPQMKKECFNEIKELGDLIVKGVELPSIGEHEGKMPSNN